MTALWIGIDDTDTSDTPGTGKLARQLVAEIERFGGRHLGTTGHQFMIDPRIPYTGHNRGICVGIDWQGPASDLYFAFDWVQHGSAAGSDPGVCIARADAVREDAIAWGNRALSEVLAMDEAVAIAHANQMDLRPLGGTGGGIIGALASVGLRAGGEGGRYVDMPGLRSLGESVTIQQIESMGIHVDYTHTAATRPNGTVLKTLGWIRPRLSRKVPVLLIEWSDEHDAWIPVDRRKVHPVE